VTLQALLNGRPAEQAIRAYAVSRIRLT
jgi:hypothetical protein